MIKWPNLILSDDMSRFHHFLLSNIRGVEWEIKASFQSLKNKHLTDDI